MNTILLALTLAVGGVHNHTQPPPQPQPAPLCAVWATSKPSRVWGLVNITATLKPGCPANGEAHVVLISDGGATDPVNSYQVLTPCTPTTRTCTYTWAGTLPLQGWRPYWEAWSGARHLIPVASPP